MPKSPKKKHQAKHFAPISVQFLKLGLFAIALQVATFAIVVQDTLTYNPYYVALYYLPLVEYIALSFTLVALGVLLFEIIANDFKE